MDCSDEPGREPADQTAGSSVSAAAPIQESTAEPGLPQASAAVADSTQASAAETCHTSATSLPLPSVASIASVSVASPSSAEPVVPLRTSTATKQLQLTCVGPVQLPCLGPSHPNATEGSGVVWVTGPISASLSNKAEMKEESALPPAASPSTATGATEGKAEGEAETKAMTNIHDDNGFRYAVARLQQTMNSNIQLLLCRCPLHSHERHFAYHPKWSGCNTCLFCEDCAAHITIPSDLKCPGGCNGQAQPHLSDAHNIVQSSVGGVQVSCKYHDGECQFIGSIRDIEEHERTCLYRNWICPFCQDRLEACNRKLHEHKECRRRMVPCEYCRETKAFEELKTHMENECPKFPKPCVNSTSGCPATVTSEDLPRHRETCEFEPTRCPVCGLNGLRRDVALQHKDPLVAYDHINKLHQQQALFQKEMERRQEELEKKVLEHIQQQRAVPASSPTAAAAADQPVADAEPAATLATPIPAPRRGRGGRGRGGSRGGGVRGRGRGAAAGAGTGRGRKRASSVMEVIELGETEGPSDSKERPPALAQPPQDNGSPDSAADARARRSSRQRKQTAFYQPPVDSPVVTVKQEPLDDDEEIAFDLTGEFDTVAANPPTQLPSSESPAAAPTPGPSTAAECLAAIDGMARDGEAEGAASSSAPSE